jgi:HAD superfamily hydrolase (TIGR01549 family)
VLGELRDAGVSLGVVTNCSETLGRTAIDRIAVQFRVVVTAERAGYYKPDPRPYQKALGELGRPQIDVCSWLDPAMTCLARRELACRRGGTTESG